jgi:hypothetical protein
MYGPYAPQGQAPMVPPMWMPPVPAPRRDRPVFIALAAVLWAVTAMALAFVLLTLAWIGVWIWADGQNVMPLVAVTGGVLAGLALLLTAAYHAPGFRKLAPSVRLTILGALAAATPLYFVVRIMTYSG